jgi:hypothetical protein
MVVTKALQKPWMKDLPPSTITMAKAKEATKAWNDTVEGILTAAKAIYQVREKIGGAPKGSFGAWAEEELGKMPGTAASLAVIGSRYSFFNALKNNLPPSWGTLYELVQGGG